MGDVEIWRVQVTPNGAPAVAAAAQYLLTEPELKHSAELDKSQRDGEQRLIAHTAVKLVLAERLNMDPQRVMLAREACSDCGGPHGRLVVARVDEVADPTSFSFAYRAGLVVIAVAAAPVGVALGTPISDCIAAVTVLHPDERKAILALPPAVRGRALVACQVRKRAYQKGLGVGNVHDATAQLVGLGPDYSALTTVPSSTGLVGEDWVLASVPVPSEFVAAVALHVPGARKDLRLHALDLDLQRALH